MGCDASRGRKKTGLGFWYWFVGFFLCSLLFFPPHPYTPCFGCGGILQPLYLELEQLKTGIEETVSWQRPGASLMRPAALAWAGCGEQHAEDTGHLLMSLSSRSRLYSIKRLHKTVVARCFNGIYYDSWGKAMVSWSNCSLPEESFYWAYLQLRSDTCDKFCVLLFLPSSSMGHHCLWSCSSAKSPESFN